MSAGRSLFCFISLASAVIGIIQVRADIDSRYVCENSIMHLTCGPSTVLKIEGADFGESPNRICRKGEPPSQLCKLMDKTETVRSRCNDKRDCSITVMRSIFGDPCLGMKIQSSSIYLNVIYACVKAVNSGEPTTSQTTPTQLPTVTSTAEDNAINASITFNPPLNHTMMRNFTQPLTTKPNKKAVTTIRSEEKVPRKEIPVFDPEKSVDLEGISGSARMMGFSSVGFLSWICTIGLFTH